MSRSNSASRRLNPVVFGTLAALLAARCSVTQPPATSPAEPGATAAAATLPPIADIPYYKADAARSGLQPGPGPLVQPVQAWRVELGCSAGGATTGVVGDGLLIVGCDAPRVSAIDLATGSIRWAKDIDGPVEGAAIDGGTAYVADMGGGLTAIDLASGGVGWHIRRDGGGETRFWSPVVSGGVVYAASHDGRFVGYDADDGSEVWSWAAGTGVASIGGTVFDGTAYISGDDGYQRAISIADGHEEWSFRTLSDVVSSVSISDAAVFVAAQGAGVLYALDRGTGAELWRYQSPTGAQVAPPVNADGVVYAPSMPDGLVAVDAHDGRLLWRTTVGSVGGQSPAIAGDAIYQNTQRGVGAYARADGRQLWAVDLGAANDSSALVTGGMVIVTDDHGLVRAFVDPAFLANFPGSTSSTAQPPSAGPVPSSLPDLLTQAGTFDEETSEISSPWGIAAAPNGNVYVVNAGTDEILVLDPSSGEVVTRWGKTGSDQGDFDFRDPAGDPGDTMGGIAVGLDGTVYVADAYNRRVQQFTPDGTFVRGWGRFGSDDGQFLDPGDVAVGPDGDVYVHDLSRSDIQRFTSDGKFVAVIGEYGTGAGQLNQGLGGIDVGADGTLYYANFDDHRLEAWKPDGSVDWVMRGDGTRDSLMFPSDVVVDEGGHLYVSEGPLEEGGRRISIYDQERLLIGQWVASGPVTKLAYGGANLYASCFFTSQILKLGISDE
ncbi:MAG TPA: PQQ-binding-like beta-propeller repeat protein [Candidatus Limnocylindrales bacterium]|nr:PQQ-binding-like beta-propeller repeat protein [Candidatus Limnocylindrales bacterium]